PGVAARGGPRGHESRALEGSRVLVVDDNEDFLQVSAMILRRAGADVRAVSSAASALELARDWLPDALLTDLAMPEQDGFALIDAMRPLLADRKARAAMIVITADGTPQARARAHRAGVDLYLTKPVDPTVLVSAVGGVLPPTPDSRVS